MNPLALQLLLKAGTAIVDRVLTEEKPDAGEIKSAKKQIDPNATFAQNAAATIQARKISMKKGGRSLIVTAIGAVLYFTVEAGYISPASMQCMIEAASEVESKVIQEQQAGQ